MRLNSGVEVTRRPAGPRAFPPLKSPLNSRRPAAGSWTPSLSLPRQTMAGDGRREEIPWENLFEDHMQDDFATVSGSGSTPEEEVFSNL